MSQESTDSPESVPQVKTDSQPSKGLRQVQIRLVNISQLDFDNVSVQLAKQEVDYGVLPSGKPSSYQTVQEAYPYAGVVISANGKTYEKSWADAGYAAALSAGHYSYVLDIVDDQLQMTYLPDNEARVDVDLVGSDWYWASAQLVDNRHLFPMSHEEHPFIRFTSDGDANAPGLHFEGYTSCNSMRGAYHVNLYHSLVVDEIGTTKRQCEASDSETFFLDVLRGINFYSIEGDYLFLSSKTGEMMTFTRHEPASEPPYATDSHAALAPIAQSIRRRAIPIQVTSGSPLLPSDTSSYWEIEFLDQTISVYVFDDAAAAEEAIKSTFSDQSPEHLWQDERFIITYNGAEESVYEILNEQFGEPQSS